MSSELQLDVCCLSCCGGDIWWTLTKERQAWCYLKVKLCDPCLSTLRVPSWPKRRYINTLPFLSFTPHYTSSTFTTKQYARTAWYTVCLSVSSEDGWTYHHKADVTWYISKSSFLKLQYAHPNRATKYTRSRTTWHVSRSNSHTFEK